MTGTGKLQAINTMLAAISQAPVQQLDGVRTRDVSLALTTLDEVSREFQSSGWSFNTDYDYSLARNVNNEIELPENVSHLFFSRNVYRTVDPVVRGRRLYDRKNQTYEFDADQTAEKLVLLLDFDDLPETAKRFVTIRAARIFEKRIMGNPNQQAYSAEEEQRAWLEFQRTETENQDANVYRSVEHMVERYYRGEF
jgi:hypothetical protein